MLEAKLQTKVLQYSNERNIVAVKVDSTSTRGWPDLTAVLPDGTVLFVELKKHQTGRLSPHQKRVHKRLENNCANIHTIETLDEFIEIVERFIG